MSTDQNRPNKKSSLNRLDENVAGLLAYSVGFVSGIIFLVLEKKNRFIRFHAIQSVLLSIVYVILFLILAIIPVIGWFIFILIMPAALILWIALMLKVYRHEYFKIPIIGDIAEKQISKTDKQ